MQGAPPSPAVSTAQSLRELRRGVAQAGDAQMLRVVRMVDSLAKRDGADGLLDPIRPRLRAIQPSRPLRFARLLFLPVDPLIVAPKAWRPGTPFVPRTALAVLAHAIRTVMAENAANTGTLDEIDRLIEGADTSDAMIVGQAGSMLWPLAASVLRLLAGAGSTSPNLKALAAEWSRQGLSPTELRPTTQALAPALNHGAFLHSHHGPGDAVLEGHWLTMLSQAEAAGPRAHAMMLSLLLIRAPQIASVLASAGRGAIGPGAQLESAAEAALDWVAAETANQAAGVSETAAAELAQRIALLDALNQAGGTARRGRVAATRDQVLAGCVQRFGTAVNEQLTTPLHAIAAGADIADADLAALEAGVRNLRCFEMEARRLGGAVAFDRVAADTRKAIKDAAGLMPMERARLLEIMTGGGAEAMTLLTPDV